MVKTYVTRMYLLAFQKYGREYIFMLAAAILALVA